MFKKCKKYMNKWTNNHSFLQIEVTRKTAYIEENIKCIFGIVSLVMQKYLFVMLERAFKEIRVYRSSFP
jgi:hypothetical protein